MAKAKLYYTSTKYLDSLPVKNGNIVFVPDNNTVCLDMSGQRFIYQTIKVFPTEKTREQTPFLVEGFYFVTESNILYRWDGKYWNKVTPSNLTPVVYGETEEEFPAEGAEGTLYYTDDGIYNWQNQLSKYNLIANANKWDSINEQ